MGECNAPPFLPLNNTIMLTRKQQQLLEKQHHIEELKNRQERYTYLGLLSDYQLHPPSVIQSLSYTKLNPHQHFLFKRVLHGLNMYKKDEIESMHWDKKRRIKKVWRKGQDTINEMKQYVAYVRSQKIFCLFKHSNMGVNLLNEPFEYVPDYQNKQSLKELGLTYEDLIIKFIGNGLLPRNYLSLKSNGHKESIKEDGSNKQRVLKAKT
jgi:hypothetical protein